MVGDTGLEPLNASGHLSDKSPTQGSQDTESAEVVRNFAQQNADKLGPNKDRNGDFSCCTGVAQEAAVLRELKLVIFAWENLSGEIRKAILAIIKASFVADMNAVAELAPVVPSEDANQP
jgi:hypothetical protein